MRRGRGLIRPLLVLSGLLVGALAARRVDVVEVRGRSMAPSLLPGDRLLVVRATRPPHLGEVVLASDPRDAGRELVKRIASLDRFGVALRGDNPAFSTDARTFGSIPASAIRWRAVLRYWPRERFGRIPPAPSDLEGGESACTFPGALIAG
jgi:nickel-type superoxide dismutase maturation protease